MRKRSAILLSLGLLAATALGLFATRPSRADDIVLGIRCEYNHDCPEPLWCIESRCRSACIEDRDCPEGMACEAAGTAKVCRKVPVRASCVRHSDCASGRCTKGKC